MPEDHFGEDVARSYDEDHASMFESGQLAGTVEFLAQLGGSGPVLELGIGTGRVALPLAERGLEVHGIDLSSAMIERLRAKPGGSEISAMVGDFATAELEQRFSLAYLVFNTIMNLSSQDEQVACFENVARHLRPGGRFVVEVMVPQLQRLGPGERHHVYEMTDTHLGVDEYDVATQRLISHHYRLDADGIERVSTPFRYVWPSELDLMARLAGMRLRERWSGWGREPFTSASPGHISVWEKRG